MMWKGLVNTQKPTLNNINHHKPTSINIHDVNEAQKYLETNINQHQPTLNQHPLKENKQKHDVNGAHKYSETNINQHQPP